MAVAPRKTMGGTNFLIKLLKFAFMLVAIHVNTQRLHV